MHDLKMPEPFSRGGVQCEQAVGEQILSMSFSPIEIRLSRLGRDVNDAAFFIQRLAAPGHQTGRVFVSVLRPGVVAHLARPGDQVEDPTLLAGPDVESPNRTLAAEAANDQDVLVSNARRIQARAKIDRAILAETSDRFSGFRIQCEK